MDAFCAKTVFAPDPLFDPSSASFPPKLVLPLTREYVLPICCAIDRVLNPTKYASFAPPSSAHDIQRVAYSIHEKAQRCLANKQIRDNRWLGFSG
jgi:hypothetical protein